MFEKVKIRKPVRDVHNMSHKRDFSAKMANLIPIFCEDVVPGDHFKINSEVLARMAPMVAPMMHKVNVNVDYFFVPLKIVTGKHLHKK